MSPREIFALRDHLGAELKGRTISDAHDVVSLTGILSHTVLGGRLHELSGRAVLLKLSDQLRSGLAMIELDGIARRMLLCPPDLNPAHLDALIADAGIDAVVTDEPELWAASGVPLVVTAQLPPQAAAPAKTRARHRMADAHLGHLGRAKDRRPYAGSLDRCDRRRRPIARTCTGLGNVLRHPPLWRPANLSPRHPLRRLVGAVRSP
ncbi:hypothetical protein ABH992_004822 [Bradyrhizobium yuanmingense]|uniref:Uncharacterized protein n=1 Tax=Bradyrhizobium yuanmingense TaxID=108015 RepID=A0ABV4GKF0_9BRAD